jgi:hypothetical protein
MSLEKFDEEKLLEVFTHGADLNIFIGNSDQGGLEYQICHGDRSHSRLILISPCPYPSEKEVIESVVKLLRLIIEGGVRNFSNPTRCEPDQKRKMHIYEPANALNEEIVTCIKIDLEARGCAQTRTYNLNRRSA